GCLVARFDRKIDSEKGPAHAANSLHSHRGVWKLLGIGVDLPDDLVANETSPEARANRVKAPPEIRKAAEDILALSRDGTSDTVWDNAGKFFQTTVTKPDFV